MKRISQQICKIFLLHTDKELPFGFVLSNYETTPAFFCLGVKTLSALVTGSRSLQNGHKSAQTIFACWVIFHSFVVIC